MKLFPNWNDFAPGRISIGLEYEDSDTGEYGVIKIEKDDIEVCKSSFTLFEEKKTFNFSALEQLVVHKVKLLIDDELIDEILVPCLDYIPLEDEQNYIKNNCGKPLKNPRGLAIEAPKAQPTKDAILREGNSGYGGSYSLPYKPPITSQRVYYNGRFMGETSSCVANTAASMIDIFQNREGKARYSKVSIGYIWGGCGLDEYTGTLWDDIIPYLLREGSPPVEVVPTSHVKTYPDIYFLNDKDGYPGARSLYNKYHTDVKKYAESQRFDYMHKLDVYYYSPNPIDARRIQDTIRHEKKAVMLAISIDRSFDNVGSDGIVGPLQYSYRGGHSVLITGWKVINGKNYWEVQNSWGTSWGKNGIGYLPFDWCGIDDWTGEIQGFWHFMPAQDGTYTMPPLPTNSAPYIIDRYSDRLNIGWKNTPGVANYTIRVKNKSSGAILQEKTVRASSGEETRTYIFDLVPGTTHTLELKPEINGGVFTNPVDATTNPSKPNIKIETNLQNQMIVTSMQGDANPYGKFSGTASVRLEKLNDGSGRYYMRETKGVAGGFGAMTWTSLPKGMICAARGYAYLDINGERLESDQTNQTKDVKIGFPSVKPPGFYWTGYPLQPNTPFSITAAEWNDLAKYTNQLLEYAGKSPRTIPEVSPGNRVTAAVYNPMASALGSISGNYINQVTSGKTRVTADSFNILVERYNDELQKN